MPKRNTKEWEYTPLSEQIHPVKAAPKDKLIPRIATMLAQRMTVENTGIKRGLLRLNASKRNGKSINGFGQESLDTKVREI